MGITEKERIFNRLNSDYVKLISEGYEVVGVFLQGSQNYNLQYEDSDIDTKAIILPKFNDFVLNNKPVSTTLILESNEHIDLKDIRLMFECFKKQNINFIEILFTEYYILNPKYAELFKPIIDNNEAIARYNIFSALNCISGMSMEKYKALEHPYPNTIAKIEKFGFDPKQLHHIVRLYDFALMYICGTPYHQCLKSLKRDYLIEVKKGNTHNLQQARIDAKDLSTKTYEMVKKYMADNTLVINGEIETLFREVLVNIMRYSFKEELNK